MLVYQIWKHIFFGMSHTWHWPRKMVYMFSSFWVSLNKPLVSTISLEAIIHKFLDHTVEPECSLHWAPPQQKGHAFHFIYPCTLYGYGPGYVQVNIGPGQFPVLQCTFWCMFLWGRQRAKTLCILCEPPKKRRDQILEMMWITSWKHWLSCNETWQPGQSNDGKLTKIGWWKTLAHWPDATVMERNHRQQREIHGNIPLVVTNIAIENDDL